MNDLTNINQLQPIAGILESADFDKLSAIKEELADSWQKRQVFRTDTEARFAVLNDFKFPTLASKYWQSVREQMVHFDELTMLSFDIRRKEIDLKEVEEKIALAEPGHDLNRLEVDRDELLFQLASGKQVAKDRVREVMQWSAIKKEVNDGSFDDTNVNTHQKETLFKSAYNRAVVAPKDISAEEKLSIEGLLHGLKNEEVNKEFAQKIAKKAPDEPTN